MRYYSLQRKYQFFSWGQSPQTPLSILPVYIQQTRRYKYQIVCGAFHPDPSSLLPFYIQQTKRYQSLQHKYQTFSWGGASLPDPPIYPSCLHSINYEILDTTAQISGICPQNNLILEKESYRQHKHKYRKLLLYKRCKIVFIDAQKSKIFRLGLRPRPRP